MLGRCNRLREPNCTARHFRIGQPGDGRVRRCAAQRPLSRRRGGRVLMRASSEKSSASSASHISCHCRSDRAASASSSRRPTDRATAQLAVQTATMSAQVMKRDTTVTARNHLHCRHDPLPLPWHPSFGLRQQGAPPANDKTGPKVICCAPRSTSICALYDACVRLPTPVRRARFRRPRLRATLRSRNVRVDLFGRRPFGPAGRAATAGASRTSASTIAKTPSGAALSLTRAPYAEGTERAQALTARDAGAPGNRAPQR